MKPVFAINKEVAGVATPSRPARLPCQPNAGSLIEVDRIPVGPPEVGSVLGNQADSALLMPSQVSSRRQNSRFVVPVW